jgi:hypothetical protein
MNETVGARLGVTGVAVVCCVHDRVKREFVDLEFDPAKYKPHLCPCCENLFLREDDIPHYCAVCTGRPVHPLGGPIPEPKGAL